MLGGRITTCVVIAGLRMYLVSGYPLGRFDVQPTEAADNDAFLRSVAEPVTGRLMGAWKTTADDR